MKAEQLEQEITLIAEFMGYEFTDIKNTCIEEMYQNGYRNPEEINHLVNWECYHSSWSWLMPVVTKIEHLFDGYVDFTIGSDFVHVKSSEAGYDYRREHEVDEKRKSVYRAVVEFIVWYNNFQNGEK